jgi:hypothetical protein
MQASKFSFVAVNIRSAVAVGTTPKMLVPTLNIQSCAVVASAIFLEAVNPGFLHKKYSKKITTTS